MDQGFQTLLRLDYFLAEATSFLLSVLLIFNTGFETCSITTLDLLSDDFDAVAFELLLLEAVATALWRPAVAVRDR